MADCEPVPLKECEQISADVVLFNDICLDLGPLTSANDLGPLFELRSFIELRTHGQSRPLTFPYSLAPLRLNANLDCDFSRVVGSVAAQFENGWRRIGSSRWDGWTGTDEEGNSIKIDPAMGEILDCGPWLKSPIGEGNRHEFTVNWEAVDAMTLAQMVNVAKSGSGQILFSTVGPHPRPSELPPDDQTFRELEIALHTGAIEIALIEQCQHLKLALSNRIKQATERRYSEIRAMRERWDALREK